MDYANYEIQDFVSDEFFIQWVTNGSPEAARFWEDYRNNNPAQRYSIDEARKFLITLRKAEHTLHTPKKVNDIWQHIEHGISGNVQVEKHPKRSFSFFKVAACLAILAFAMVSWYVFKLPSSLDKAQEGNIHMAEGEFLEEVNNTGDVIQIHLSDGSIVDLQDKSRLRYRKDHTGYPCREAYLTGEAFFDIARNPKQPFLVYTNEVVTKVLGTSFRIRAFEADKDIVVAVKEGKVSVYSAREKKESKDSIVSEVNGVVLTSNQQVVYARTEDMFVRTLISNPEIIQDSPVKSLFVFENAPVTEVFQVLQNAYGVEIIVDKEVMSNCFLTVRLINEPLFEQLKIVCRTIGAKYELMDAKIIINGKGC